MIKHANRWWAAFGLLCMLCMLPLAARSYPADPAVWGVYAQLVGGKYASEKQPGAVPYLWAWDGSNSHVVEDRGETWGSTQIASLGGGRLARLVKGKHTWTGVVQGDGAVVWEPEGNFLTRVAGDPYRVRMEGGVVVLEYVHVKDGRVAEAWPLQRLVSLSAVPAPVDVATAPVIGTVPPAADAVTAQAPAASEVEAGSGPRTLSEADLARLRASMARDKQQRAQTLARQEEEARQQAQALQRAAELQAQMAAQRQQEYDDDDDDGDGFATALMSGLSVFQGEMSKYRAQQAQQQAFVANLQRQQAEAVARRQREAEQQRQAAAQAQRTQVAAASQQHNPQQQQQIQQQQQQQQQLLRQQAAEREAASRAEADRQLRERAAAERLRQQQVREQQQVEGRLASTLSAGAAPVAGQASTHDDPGRCVSQPTQVPNPNCKDGSAFTLRNSCAQTVEMRLCIKTRQGTWDCGASQGIPPGGSWGHPSCTGTSTTFLDVRSAGSGRRFADPPF